MVLILIGASKISRADFSLRVEGKSAADVSAFLVMVWVVTPSLMNPYTTAMLQNCYRANVAK